jgi:hypothetical protein
MKCRLWLFLGATSVIMLQSHTTLAEPQAVTPPARSTEAMAPAAVAAPAAEAVSPAPPAVAATTAAPETAPAPSAKAHGYFYRKHRKLLGAALNTSVHVDGMEIAELDPGRYVKVPLEPGSHSFYSDEKDDTITVDVETGKDYYFRVDLQAGMWKGHGKFKLMTPEEGSKEFGEWKLKLADDIKKPDMVVEDESKRSEK